LYRPADRKLDDPTELEHKKFSSAEDFGKHFDVVRTVTGNVYNIVIAVPKNQLFDIDTGTHSMWLVNGSESQRNDLESGTMLFGCGPGSVLLESAANFDAQAACSVKWTFAKVGQGLRTIVYLLLNNEDLFRICSLEIISNIGVRFRICSGCVQELPRSYSGVGQALYLSGCVVQSFAVFQNVSGSCSERAWLFFDIPVYFSKSLWNLVDGTKFVYCWQDMFALMLMHSRLQALTGCGHVRMS
jgi:hypothetical protein